LKASIASTVITGIVVTVSMCATSWGLTAQVVEQQATNDDEPTVVIENRTTEPLALDFEVGVPNWLKFQQLVRQWKSEVGASSSITKAIMAKPYHAIIGMGPEALPLIFAQLRSEGNDPDQWFWALESITGENPTRPEDRGDYLKMAQSWLEWDKENNG
jgi:hypothetical protein